MRPMALILFPLIAFMLSGLVYTNFTLNATCASGSFAGGCSTNNLTLFGFPQWLCQLLPNAEVISGTCANTGINPFAFVNLFVQPSGLFFIISLLASVILLILGSGLTVAASGQVLASGASAEIGVNDAGTKFYRDLGIGFLVWSFATALEGAWCDSIPGGFAGGLCLVLEILFIAGIWWQSETQV